MKERNLSRLNKKGVSVMIGYVLLIVIAISLSAAVFFYLKLYIPENAPECGVDIRLVLDSVSCSYNNPPSTSAINVNLSNKGLFTVDGAFIKIGDNGRKFKTTLNEAEDGLSSLCNNFNTTLKPGEHYCGVFQYPLAPTSIQEISIEPFIWIDNKAVLCPDAVITRNVVCS